MSTKLKKRSRIERMSKSQWGFFWLFVAPPLLIFSFLVVLPMLYNVYWSFFDYSGYGEMTWVGLENYKTALSDPYFGKAALNDLIILLGKEVMVVVLAVTFSVSIARLKFKTAESNFLRFFYYMPNILSAVVIAKVWKYFFDFDLFGAITGLQNPANGWITEYTLPIITFVASWCGIGGFMIILIAAINNIPQEQYEAAEVDGAGQFRQLFSITIPSVWPQIKYMMTSIILSIIGSNMNFVKLFIGDGTGTFTVMGVYQYDYAFTRYRLGYASAVGLLLMLMVLVVTYVLNYGINRKGDD